MFLHYCLVGVMVLGFLEKTFALPPCAACITTTRTGQKVTQTLLYHSYYTCTGIVSRCVYNGTELNICIKGKSKTCYNPRQTPSYYVLEIRWNDEDGALINATRQLPDPTKHVDLSFDACEVINRNTYHKCGYWEHAYYYDDKYMCPEGAYRWGKCTGKSSPTVYSTSSKDAYYCPKWECVYYATWVGAPMGRDGDQRVVILEKLSLPEPKKCKKGACNPVRLIIFNPSQWKQGYKFGQRIAGGGIDPGTFMYIQLNTKTHVSAPYRIHHSFNEVMKAEFEIPHASQNLFLELAGAVASSLHISDCFFCGGTKMGDQWPWEAQEVNYSIPYNQTDLHNTTSEWVLAHPIVGNLCFARSGPQFNMEVGQLVCLNQKFYNSTTKKTTWWSGINASEPSNPLVRFPNLASIWTNLASYNSWQASPGLYWICGTQAYARLPHHWGAACALGFFLLPTSHGEQLGYPVYRSRQKREALKIGQWDKWKEEEWPPERIISYYGPATWEQDGTWGYRTPVYMINRIICLQAVVEIITNETSKALTLLSKQSTQMRTAIYQNRLALDYLLAAEGGVCGKLNLTNCCLQIDNNGHVVEDIATQMRKQTFVPVQTWHSLKLDGWFGSAFSWLGGLKTLVFIVLFILTICLLLPCLLPLCLHMVTSVINSTVERKAATKILAMWQYYPIPQGDAVTPV